MLIAALIASHGELKRDESVVIRTEDNELSYTVRREFWSGQYKFTGNNPKSRQKVKEHLAACEHEEDD